MKISELFVTRMVNSQSISLKNTFLKTLKILKTISEFQTIPLTHYMPLVSFYAPLKHHKTPFFMFSRGIVKDQWHFIIETILVGWVL